MGQVLAFSPGHRSDDEVLAKLIGKSPVFQDLVMKLPTLARAEAAILINGETGTGKELVARAIHHLSPRAGCPFVAVNCGSFVDTMLEGELFGHERGAFTDAHTRQPGLVAHAGGGTLFLDEVDTLTLRAQVALLRVLQDGTFRPLGCAAEQHVDVRVMAATNARLDGLVQGGAFRADLYYRLCVFSINLPPLRDRRDDIPPLAVHFLAKHAPSSRPAPKLSALVMETLLGYDWPGNVRELESAIVRALHLAQDGNIQAGDFGIPGQSAPVGARPALPEGPASYKTQKRQVVDAFEHDYLIRLMTDHQGNVSRAARAAGKERRDLGKLLKRHGLDRRRFSA